MLDKGTDDGIKVGDVVIAAGGALAGRVTEVGPTSAKVLLLTDSELDRHRPADDQRRDRRGRRPARRRPDHARDRFERDRHGRRRGRHGRASSSAAASARRIPKGLLIGQVVDVRRDANVVVQTAFLQPAADLDKLEYVLVITDYEGGLPPIEQQPVDCGADGALPEGEQPCLAPSAKPSGAPSGHAQAVTSAVPGQPRLLPLPAMKGIVLAGGTATRLYPLTIVTNKHLLPIYDRPMIYYPIETLAGMGIREVMVIVGGKSVGDVVELLADGSHFGLDLTYRYQRGALGIAHAIGLARDFVGDDAFCCVLGDNILRGPPLADVAAEFESGPCGAGTLLYRVPDPERFGVAELDADGRVVGFEEKPDNPKSDLIPIGVYFLRPDAFEVIDRLAPSGRGEFEITDVLNHYIPGERPVQPGLRGPLDRRRDGPVAAPGGRARRRRRRRRGPARRRRSPGAVG